MKETKYPDAWWLLEFKNIVYGLPKEGKSLFGGL